MPMTPSLSPARTPPHFNTLVYPLRTAAILATAGNLVYTAAQVLGGLILRATTGAARADTLPTAAALVAAISGVAVGSSFRFHLRNDAAAAETITLGAGAGGTTKGTMTVAQNNMKEFLIVFTSVTPGSETYDVYSLGTVVF